MNSVIITSIFCLFAGAIVSFSTSIFIFKGKSPNKEKKLFAWAWFFIGLILALMGARTTSFLFGFLTLDKTVAFIIQLIMPVVFIVLGAYVFYLSIESNKIRNVFINLLFIAALVFLFFLVKQGLVGPEISEWGSEYTAPRVSNFSMIFLAGAGFLALIYKLFEEIKARVQNKNQASSINSERLMAIISLLILIIAGALEQIGNVGWVVLLLRVSILFSALLGFLAYNLREPEEI